MLKKLIKYEWKGLIFPFVIMLIVLAGTTLLTCAVLLTINPKYDESVQVYSAMALMLSIFLYYFGMIGCTLGTTLIIALLQNLLHGPRISDAHTSCHNAPDFNC